MFQHSRAGRLGIAAVAVASALVSARVGSRDAIEAAFAAAGWTTASAANAQTSVKTFLAVVHPPD